MPTYVYETVPRDSARQPVRFELDQRMNESALTKHPETGEAVRRVITGGFGYMGKDNLPKHADMQRERSSGGGSCGTGCGCH